MKTRYLLFGIMAALFSACGDDDDKEPALPYTVETVGQAPTWQVDFSGNESRPDWQEPNPASFENWAIVLVQVEDALKPYVTNNDLMAFFVGDELRGLTSPAVSQGAYADKDKGTFVLKAYGNEADQNMVLVTLRYYCAQLRQTFSRTVQMRYDMGTVYGLDEDIIPQFTLGTPSYPVVMQVDPTTIPAFAEAAITPTDGDIVAAFVGSECRGVGPMPSGVYGDGLLTVYGRTAGERVTLRYYQPATGSLYTFPDVVVTGN